MTEWSCSWAWKVVRNQQLCFLQANRQYRLVISVLHLLSSRNTRSLALNPDIRPFQSFLFCATSGMLLFTGMKRLLLAAISCLLKKAPDSINADRQIQRFNDLQTCDIRLFFQKRKDVLMICIGQFWLLSTEIRLSFVAARFVPTLQQTIYRKRYIEQVFTEKHFASSFTLMPLPYPSKINFRASLCSIALTFFASVIPLFAQKLKYCAVLLKIAII